MIYTGIGSRRTPDHILKQMTSIATQLAELGFHLRSGKAEGADWAFQKGAMSVNGKKTIYVPDGRFGLEQTDDKTDDYIVDGELMKRCQVISASVHNNWKGVSHYGKLLQGRNCCQVLGHDLDNILKSDFVLYWAPVNKKGRVMGGTGTAVRIAEKYGIPTINMLDDFWRWRLTDTLNLIYKHKRSS